MTTATDLAAQAATKRAQAYDLRRHKVHVHAYDRPCLGVVRFFIGRDDEYGVLIDEADWPLVRQYRWAPDRKKGRVYVIRRTPTRISLHQFLLQPPAGLVSDHRDGDSLNNRRSNLRSCTVAENTRNQRPCRGQTSRFKGVHWKADNQTWIAQITKDYKNYYLGTFKSEVAAAGAYDKAAMDLHGEFACLNFRVLG